MVGKHTAEEAWDELNRNHASQSRSRVMELQAHLNNQKKGTLPLETHIQTFRTVGDEMAVSGCKVEEGNLMYSI